MFVHAPYSVIILHWINILKNGSQLLQQMYVPRRRKMLGMLVIYEYAKGTFTSKPI